MVKLTKEIVNRTKIPVTVKMRAGWNSESIVSTQAGVNLEKIGVKAITLHPRTTVQMYKGSADWNMIGELKETVKTIPIIGNGDITCIDDYKKLKYLLYQHPYLYKLHLTLVHPQPNLI